MNFNEYQTKSRKTAKYPAIGHPVMILLDQSTGTMHAAGDPAAGPADASEHVGLRIMRERAQRIGATLDVRSQPGRGTEIALSLPVAQREAA